MCGRLQTSINSIFRRKNHINEHFMKYWKTSVAAVAMNPILRTYNLFKPDLKYETYFEVAKDGRYSQRKPLYI